VKKPYTRKDFLIYYKSMDNRRIAAITIEQFLSQSEQLDKHYKVACAWSGALSLAGILKRGDLLDRLIGCYNPFKNSYSELLQGTGHVDNNVFGIVPLEIFLQRGEPAFLVEGKSLAEHQIAHLNQQMRYAIDDMFMIPRLQIQAYRGTQDVSFLDTAALVLSLYIDELQQQDGLFYHHRDFPHKWSRGNGWVAAGFASILRWLPIEHSHYPVILKGYRLMMQGLSKTQIPRGEDRGLWNQILDSKDSRNWAETSGSAMFAYALICGIKQGILDENTYLPVFHNSFNGLINQLNEDGSLRNISKWAYKPESHPESGDRYKGDEENYYFQRELLCGDFHGQAPLMWVLGELLEGGGIYG